MIVHLLAAAGVLALLTIAPGPDMAVVTRRSLLAGRADALRTVAGVVCGLLVWGTLTVLGLAALLAASSTAYVVVQVAGVGYLLYLGIQALRRGSSHDEGTSTEAPHGRSFRAGLVTNLSNPKIAVFYTALLPTLAPPSSGAWGLMGLVLLHAVITAGWLGLYAYTLDRARAVLMRPRVKRAIDVVTGVALLGFAARLAVEHP